jgi:hypothetical protein
MLIKMLRNIENFDLGKLNIVGWLLFFVCVGLAIGAICLLVNSPFDPSNGHGFVHEVTSHALGYTMLGLAALVFLVARLTLGHFGISIYRKIKPITKK